MLTLHTRCMYTLLRNTLEFGGYEILYSRTIYIQFKIQYFVKKKIIILNEFIHFIDI